MALPNLTTDQKEGTRTENDEVLNSSNHGESTLIPNFSLTHPLILSAATALDTEEHPHSSDNHSDVDAQPSESAPEHDDVDVDTNEPFVTAGNENENLPLLVLHRTSPSVVSSVDFPQRSLSFLTRKQLIERERQARLERKRAKLKRHFANNREREEEAQAIEEADIARIGSDDMDDDPESSSSFSVEEIHSIDEYHENLQDEIDTANHLRDISMTEELIMIRPPSRNEIVVEAALNVESQENSQQPQLQLGYTMERFLNERNPSPNVAHGRDTTITMVHDRVEHPVYPDDITHIDHNPHVYIASGNIVEHDINAISHMSVISNENMSVEAHQPSSDISSPTRLDLETSILGREYLDGHPTSPYYPRLARLTEAEAFEFHDIDYASVGNFPPRSIRDEQHLPEIRSNASHVSHVTETTLHESQSSTPSRSSSIHITEEAEEHHISESSNDEKNQQPLADLGLESFSGNYISNLSKSTDQQETLSNHACDKHSESSSDRKLPFIPLTDRSDMNKSFDSDENTTEDIKVLRISSMSSVQYPQNRQIRPGMGEGPQRYRNSNNSHRRAQTTPVFATFVDDFDYSKYNDGSVESGSPPRKSMQHLTLENGIYAKNYGSTANHDNSHNHINVEGIKNLLIKDNVKREMSYDEMVDSIFSSVRSMSTDDIQAEIDECEAYANKGAIDRALSGRFQELLVTLIIEIPVFLIIAGGSDRLHKLLGQAKFQLLLAFLPLSSSIAGHCGIQASELATRAVAHLHVSKKNYFIWLYQELKVALILGCAVGFVMGSTAVYASSMIGPLDMKFGFVIFIANFVNILSAGLTGTLAPLTSTYICHRESIKWRGALQTAFQDCVGSFMMIICGYHLLILFHPLNKE